ncbi:DUF262 domain-containing protein [Butyrivibrio sp. AD3002]|uniref:DUF262 domain-containing protein n=1 Tax=Butyrivibrio sp. AD3002 TaxID=1280670 RepID=UPI0003B54CAA|nr:DUF262 domain-containing protein [Butyrivibrio sp. AD3002]
MQNSKEIISEMENIYSVLLDNAVAYYIPEFQRNFVWGKEEITQLISDFTEDTDGFSADTNDLEGYLLGNIVLIDQGKKKIVVDGQQRLTTLSLFAKAISIVLSEHINEASTANNTKMVQTWSKRVGEIEKGFFILDDADDVQGLKIQHDPSLAFGNYYSKLIFDKNEPSDIIKEEDANIDIVYSQIYEFLSDLSDDQFIKFIQYFKTKIKIIVTSAPTEAKAFQLFEILNARGMSLEPMDLIKNTFLKTLSVEGKSELQISDFNQDWQGMMGNLQLGPKKKIASSTFLKQFLIAFRGENKKADQLFNYFKDPSNGFDGNTILDFIENMNKVSSVYREIELGNYCSFGDDQNMFILFKLLGIKQFHPLLMIFYSEEKEKKAKILDSITRLGAVVLFSYTQTNYIEKILPEIIKSYWTTYEKDKKAAFDNLISSIESHINELTPIMKANISTRNFVGKNGEVHSKALMLLKFIELYFNQNTKVQSVPKGKKITVEHILSRNLDLSNISLNDLGFSDDTERRDSIHKLGNLTLLYNTDNASVGNGSFKEKCPAYRISDFVMTSTIIEPVETGVKNGLDTRLFAYINKFEKQYISQNGQWTKELIETRSNDLAKLLECIVKNSYNED